MADYGRAIRFGVFPTPEADAVHEVLALARLADEEDLEYVGIQDHPYQRRHLDAWMLMAMVLARTERVSVFPDVANPPLRPPAVMAKAAASLDVLSGGRFELGLGAGAFWEAALGAGRDPGAIARVYNLWGAIDGTGGFLQGDVSRWVEELTQLAVEHGMDTFVFGPSGDPVVQLHRFAAAIPPALVAHQR